MSKKLIFLDIDGTLTPAGSNFPPESAMAAVRKAQKAGHLVFLCTGRNPAMLAPVLALGFDGAVAGAGGYVFAGDEVLFDCPMPKDQFELGTKNDKQMGGNNYLDGILYSAFIGAKNDNGKFIGKYVGGERYAAYGIDICGSCCLK